MQYSAQRPDLALGVQNRLSGPLWRKLSSSIRAGWYPMASHWFRRTTVPPFPPYPVRSTTTLDHRVTETTHLAATVHPFSGTTPHLTRPFLSASRWQRLCGRLVYSLVPVTPPTPAEPSSEVTRLKSHARSRSSPCLCCNRCIPARKSGAERRPGPPCVAATIACTSAARWPVPLAQGPLRGWEWSGLPEGAATNGSSAVASLFQ